MGNPVIFVHGIGASALVWEKIKVPTRETFYLSFRHHFSSPAKEVPELERFIREVLSQTKKEKVILVCHSMGGLVARKYLAKHKDSHQVEKLILLCVPNLGTLGLSLDWIPIFMIGVGLVAYRYIWPLILSVIGLGWVLVSLLRGVLLLYPAERSMRPGSRFLKELNAQALPTDVRYISILSDTRYFPHVLVNLLLFREGGDGAVPLSSQKLSGTCVPNFSELNYSELKVDLPHFAIPKWLHPKIIKAIEMG